MTIGTRPPKWAANLTQRLLAEAPESMAFWEIMASALAATRDAERERCAKLIEDGFDKEVGKPYAEGHKSKNDRCPHDRAMYEDCDQCCVDAIRRGTE